MRNIWQYLSHVEPVLPTPRVGQDIPWTPSLPDLPGRSLSLPVAAIAICSFVSAPVAAEVITVDKWSPSLTVPSRDLPRVVDYSTYAENPLEIPKSQHTTWYTELSQPNRSLQPRLQYETNAENPLEVPKSQHITWFTEVSQPQRDLKRIQYKTNAEDPLEVPKSQHITWYTELSLPGNSVVNLQYKTNAEEPVNVPVVQPTNISWYTELSRPQVIVRPAQPGLGADSPLTVPAPIPSSNEWYPSLTVPTLRTLPSVVDYRTYAENVPQPPAYSACSWHTHFNSRGWANIQAQIDAGYPIYAQPTELTGSYEEIIDYGLLLTNNIVTVRWSENHIVGDIDVVCKIASSTDGISYTAFTTGTSVFYSSMRYVKIRLEFAAINDKELLEIDNLEILLDVKREVDSGQVTALAADGLTGTEVFFNKTFKDIDSIELTVAARQPITAIYRFTDVPNPTSFHVLTYDSSGNQVDYLVSWLVRGIV